MTSPQIGDLVYIKHRRGLENLCLGLLLYKKRIGGVGTRSTVLYDVLLSETTDVRTLSDIYFDVRKI